MRTASATTHSFEPIDFPKREEKKRRVSGALLSSEAVRLALAKTLAFGGKCDRDGVSQVAIRCRKQRN